MIGLGLIKVVSMGIVQGLSEFLPISSSGHLVFTSKIFEFISHNPVVDTNYDIVLDMMLHIGTLFAVFLFFWKDIKEIWNALLFGIKTKNFEDYNTKLGLYIIFGTIVTIFVALLLDDTAERLMDMPAVVGFLLMITGVMLYSSEKYSQSLEEKSDKVSKKTAIVMAIAQGLAALPGFSRSGWTIAAGMFAKTDRVACARYSFLLSIPIILGASVVYPLKEINLSELVSYNWSYILIGTFVSAVVGYICIKYFLEFLSKYSLKAFAYYCFVVGLVATLFFTFIW
jgi:undecaprenyl-diphosphatase